MRPKDEQGLPLPPPCQRLAEADELRTIAILTIAKDGRAANFTTARKFAFANKVINHVVDGDAVPKTIWAKDADRPDNHFLAELWRAAATAVREHWRAVRPREVA